MKRVFRPVAGFFIGAMIAATPAVAQRSNTGTPFQFGVAGGLSQPTGDLGDGASLGFNITGTADVRPAAFPFPIRGDLMFNRWSLDDESGDGSARIIAAVISGVFNFPTQQTAQFRPYVLAGAGLYNGAVNYDDFEDPDSETDLGLAFGGGLRFPLSGFDSYVEARYHNVFGGEELLHGASVKQLIGIAGVGEVVAQAVVDYFTLEDNQNLVKRLMATGLNFERTGEAQAEGPLAGKRVVITGTLSKPRSYFVERLEEAGGTFTSSVSKNTDYVLAGEDAGSKLERANELGVLTLDEKAFEDLLS